MALKAVAAPLGSPVGGSGTTNTIPRWTGPSTLGDSGLIDDGSKIYATLRKFATGTHLGTAQLESRAAASDTVLRANAQAGFGDWQILGAGIVGQQLLSAPYAFVWQACNPANTAQFPISLNPNGGNVGIGTASPVTGSRLHVAGNAVTASGTTTMTDGFFYIPAAAGAPTGVPTAISGRVPMYYDTTNNNFYVYNGGWKKVLLA